MTTADKGYGICHRCGQSADKFSSGIPECWPCWNYRKMDHPAAQHWAKVADEFLSNIDLYDWTKFFPQAGLSREEATTMIQAADKLRDYSQRLLRARRPLVRLEKAS